MKTDKARGFIRKEVVLVGMGNIASVVGMMILKRMLAAVAEKKKKISMITNQETLKITQKSQFYTIYKNKVTSEFAQSMVIVVLDNRIKVIKSNIFASRYSTLNVKMTKNCKQYRFE